MFDIITYMSEDKIVSKLVNEFIFDRNQNEKFESSPTPPKLLCDVLFYST